MPLGSKKHISAKTAVVILSICLTCTTVAFLASVVYYICRRDNCPIQSAMISSDKETSYSSTSNLISQRTFSVPETKVAINFPVSHITGKIVLLALFFDSNSKSFVILPQFLFLITFFLCSF